MVRLGSFDDVDLNLNVTDVITKIQMSPQFTGNPSAYS